jgi:SAM-dependent methyltransferase
VLDLGCGNGRLLARLLERRVPLAAYLGVDSCAALLEAARARYPEPIARFVDAELFDDLGRPALAGGTFDVVALMGVLHHVPSEAARAALVHEAFERTAAAGRLILTVWRFERDSRLSKRTLAWPGSIDRSQLEPGDTLMRWSKGGSAVRYCHAIADAEIERWLRDVPASVERFHADGGGELNEYVVLTRVG